MSELAIVWGTYQNHAHLSAKNIFNAALMLVILLPSILGTQHLTGKCTDHINDPSFTTLYTFQELVRMEWASVHEKNICKFYLGNPIAFVNLLFFLNVTVLFWLIGLLQHSFWLIDPYWTIIPLLIGHFYRQHPLAQRNPSMRANVAMVLIYLWSIRLTFSYFRREKFKFGEREDWRYTKMAKRFGIWWYIISFFAVGMAQHPLLVGISLPLCSVHILSDGGRNVRNFTNLDVLLSFSCIFGLYIGEQSDRMLNHFVAENKERASRGVEKMPILREGWWRWSRHPNYFGEQLFWWSYAGFAVVMGNTWMIIGTVMNSVCLCTVTFMTEKKMLKEWEKNRAELYRQYQREVSILIPMPPSQSKSE